MTNNIGDTITCVTPTDPTWTNPQIGDRDPTSGAFDHWQAAHAAYQADPDVRDNQSSSFRF